MNITTNIYFCTLGIDSNASPRKKMANKARLADRENAVAAFIDCIARKRLRKR